MSQRLRNYLIMRYYHLRSLPYRLHYHLFHLRCLWAKHISVPLDRLRTPKKENDPSLSLNGFAHLIMTPTERDTYEADLTLRRNKAHLHDLQT